MVFYCQGIYNKPFDIIIYAPLYIQFYFLFTYIITISKTIINIRITVEACRILNENIVNIKDLSAEDRMESLNSRRLNRSSQEKDYIQRRAELVALRKGQYIRELFDNIKSGKITEPTLEYSYYDNIEFDSPIHEERSDNDEYTFY